MSRSTAAAQGRPLSRPPSRWRGWPAWGWLLLGLGALVTLGFEGWALLWVAFGLSAEHDAPETLRTASRALDDLLLVVVAPWALAAALLRPRLRVATTGLACTAPTIWLWLDVHQMSGA